MLTRDTGTQRQALSSPVTSDTVIGVPDEVHAVFQIRGYSRRGLRLFGILMLGMTPFMVIVALTNEETPVSVRLGVLVWSPAMILLSYRYSFDTAFNVELEGDFVWIHTAWRTHQVSLSEIDSIDRRGTRINTRDGRHFTIEVVSAAWIEMLDCIRLVRPDLSIAPVRPSILRHRDAFQRIK